MKSILVLKGFKHLYLGSHKLGDIEHNSSIAYLALGNKQHGCVEGLDWYLVETLLLSVLFYIYYEECYCTITRVLPQHFFTASDKE